MSQTCVCLYKVVVICIEMEMHAVIPGYVNMTCQMVCYTEPSGSHSWKHFGKCRHSQKLLGRWLDEPSVRAATRAELEAFLNETQPAGKPNPVKRAKLASKFSFNGEIQSSRS